MVFFNWYILKYCTYNLLGDKMDKNYSGIETVKEIEASFNHGITLSERKNIIVTGVKKIESFDNEDFLMDTTLGFLNIKASDLEIIKLDTYQGNVSIKGKIDSIVYTDNVTSKNKEESFLGKLFK